MKTRTLQDIIEILRDGLMAVYLYHKGEDTLPVFITHDMDFVSLDSYRDLFRSEKFMILTQDDIEK